MLRLLQGPRRSGLTYDLLEMAHKSRGVFCCARKEDLTRVREMVSEHGFTEAFITCWDDLPKASGRGPLFVDDADYILNKLIVAGGLRSDVIISMHAPVKRKDGWDNPRFANRKHEE